MRSRNIPRKPTKGPFGPMCLRRSDALAGHQLHHSERLPTSRAFLAYWGEQQLWWKLTRPTRNGLSDGPPAIRGLLWSGGSSQAWSWVNFAVYDWPGGGQHWCGDEVFVEMLDAAAESERQDRLERRAADARRRRGLKPPHPPKRCACCSEKFTPKRTDARCCTAKCRAKLSRQKPAAVVR